MLRYVFERFLGVPSRSAFSVISVARWWDLRSPRDAKRRFAPPPAELCTARARHAPPKALTG